MDVDLHRFKDRLLGSYWFRLLVTAAMVASLILALRPLGTGEYEAAPRGEGTGPPEGAVPMGGQGSGPAGPDGGPRLDDQPPGAPVPEEPEEAAEAAEEQPLGLEREAGDDSPDARAPGGPDGVGDAEGRERPAYQAGWEDGGWRLTSPSAWTVHEEGDTVVFATEGSTGTAVVQARAQRMTEEIELDEEDLVAEPSAVPALSVALEGITVTSAESFMVAWRGGYRVLGEAQAESGVVEVEVRLLVVGEYVFVVRAATSLDASPGFQAEVEDVLDGFDIADGGPLEVS